MELSAEYVGRDGKRQRLRVSCEVPGDPDPFHGLLSGVAQMRERVAELLGPLVQKEAQDRVAAVRYGALDGNVACFSDSKKLELDFFCLKKEGASCREPSKEEPGGTKPGTFSSTSPGGPTPTRKPDAQLAIPQEHPTRPLCWFGSIMYPKMTCSLMQSCGCRCITVD
ncbi:EKC/KEOPS complex subunit GON7 isoform X1 [Choloepus didactylus]|uniref:EKC/KEOPS complex subunit GON7 isoform X1 n=1 Tax=Choloepus didactylus TaxID=27675 RepID=UPI00189DFE71|nr:EKC/KEOPS complex subunit GON7 isoform X1 [Choloepus didactylus]